MNRGEIILLEVIVMILVVVGWLWVENNYPEPDLMDEYTLMVCEGSWPNYREIQLTCPDDINKSWNVDR